MSFLNFWYMWRSEYVHTKEGLPKRSIEKDYRVRARSLKFETYNLEFKRFFLFSSFYFKYKRIRYHENQLENDRWWYRCDITKIWWYRCILCMFNKQRIEYYCSYNFLKTYSQNTYSDRDYSKCNVISKKTIIL